MPNNTDSCRCRAGECAICHHRCKRCCGCKTRMQPRQSAGIRTAAVAAAPRISVVAADEAEPSRATPRLTPAPAVLSRAVPPPVPSLEEELPSPRVVTRESLSELFGWNKSSLTNQTKLDLSLPVDDLRERCPNAFASLRQCVLDAAAQSAEAKRRKTEHVGRHVV